MPKKKKVLPAIKVPVLVDKVQTLPLDAIHAYAGNAKKHPKEQVEALMRSMQRFGFLIPLLVDEAGTVIAGHGRLEAAKRLGMPEVPVIIADHLSDDERRAFTIADNRLAEQGEWDEALLSLELGDLNAHDFDLTLLGLTDSDIHQLLKTEADPDDGDDVGDPPENDYKEQHGVIVMCRSEAEQATIYERFRAEGLECKVVTT